MAGNFKLDSKWDIIIGRGATRVSGKEYVAQLVKSRILTLLGEWQQNTSLGLPWFTGLLDKNSRPSDIQSAVANIILSTRFVKSIISIDIYPDFKSRIVVVDFEATSVYGDISGRVNNGGNKVRSD